MKDFDDDFGDLYADVEDQASSAINGGREFTRFYSEPSGEDDSDGDTNNTNTKHSSENNDNGSGSESEDDLNIVLNDEDCEANNFPVVDQVDTKNEEDKDGFVAIKEEYIRTLGVSIPSDVKVNASASTSARCDWNCNVCDLSKGPSSGQNDLVGATRNSLMTQNRCGLSLPWYRSILDVNIDTFEEKPWRYPGIDITDFFNFGFNEDSWRQYCNSLEQLRSQAFMQLGNPDHVSRNQHKQVEAMNDDIDQPNGRAIQVEDGSGERQPSVDVRRPRDRDSDVVIQITLGDPIEETSDTGEKFDQSGSPQCETSNNVELAATDCSSSRKGKFSVESLEENDQRADRCSAKTTASKPMTNNTASKPMTNNTDDTERNQIPDIDGNRCDQTSAFSSDGTSDILEIENKMSGSVVLKVCTADQYMVDRELSLEEEGQLSLTSSCFESDSEALRDSSHLDCGKVTGPRRRSSAKLSSELWDSDTSHHQNQRGNYAKIKPVNFRDYSKCKIGVQGKQKHETRTVDSPARCNIAVNDNDASLLDAEDMYDKGHLSAKYGRRKDKMEDVDFTDRGDLTYYEKSKQSHCYGSREFAKDHIHTARKNYRDGGREFHEVRDTHLTQNWKERGYLCDDERREGYWCHRAPFTSDIPVAYKEIGRFVSRYSSTRNERDIRSKRKNNKLQFRKQTNRSSQIPYYEFDDADFMRERYAKSVSLINQKGDTLDDCYKRHVPERQKEMKSSGWKRYKDSSPLELEGSWSREIEDEYWRNSDVRFLSRRSSRKSDEERWIELEGSWPRKIEDEYGRNTDVHHLSHQSCREFDGGRWADPMSPRNGVSRSRFVERYRRQLPPKEGEENGWFENYNDSNKFEDGFIYPDDEIHFRRKRRCGWKSKVLPWIEEEITVRHLDEKLNFKKSSFLCKNDGRHRSLHDAMHIDGMQVDKHGYETIRDGSNNTRSLCRSQKMYRAKNDQAFQSCRDSVDLFVREEKLSRRQPVDRSLSCNSRREGTDLEGFDESRRFTAVQSSLPKVGLNHSNKNVHDRFPLAARNEDFDIEEGQIVTEEPCMADSVSAAETHGAKKRMLEDDLASHGGKTGGACDDQQILETLAKMERRRERFKEPIALKREQAKCRKPETAAPTIVETPETKQLHRPARKMQWRTDGAGSLNVTSISYL